MILANYSVATITSFNLKWASDINKNKNMKLQKPTQFIWHNENNKLMKNYLVFAQK